MLDVRDGNLVYWEVCGNPDGKPALVLHGGPGSGCTPGVRRYFDPDAYRIVLFDQRGCGRSTPDAGDPLTDLSVNTTDHLLADIEQLRELLGITEWLVFGGSWGAVLGLVYAERFPARVSELVLTGLATGRQAETDLLTRGLGGVFPDAWARFRADVPNPDGDLADAYFHVLSDPDPAVRAKAARDWCDWEDAIVPTSPPSPRYDDPAFRMTFARLVTHYWRHGSFLDDDIVLREAAALKGIPGVVVQGALDFNNMVGTPWLLERVWDCELVLIEDAGHDSRDSVADALITATDRFRQRREEPTG
jgi:proline iminopeptidase